MTFRSVRVRLSLGMAPASADQQFHLNVWRHSGTLAQATSDRYAPHDVTGLACGPQ